MLSAHRFRINAPLVASEVIDGEVVMIHFESGSYYSIDKVGADILGQLDGRTPAQITDALAERYAGDRFEIADAVAAFLARLQQEELIVAEPTDTGTFHGEPAANGPVVVATRVAFQPPVLQRYTDLQDLLRLDPIHDTEQQGWPLRKADVADDAPERS